MKFIYFIKIFIQSFIQVRKEQRLYKQDLYYKDVNEIPLLNWWNCSKGDLRYLWRNFRQGIPLFFHHIFNEMYYQLEFIDLSELRKSIEANIFENKYLATKDIKYKRKADTRKAEIESFAKMDKTETKLNNLIKFVQMTLKLSFQIDARTISAGYFFSLYHEATNKVENADN